METSANATEVGILPVKAMIPASFCEDSDLFAQACRISGYLQSCHFYGEANYKQYRRIEGAFTAPTKNQVCRPIYIDDKNNACIIFSSHRTKRARRTDPSTGKPLMYNSEITTAMIASREVWLEREKKGYNYSNLRISHFTVTMDDIWSLKYYWTGDLYNAMLDTKNCKPRCDIMSFRRSFRRSGPRISSLTWVRFIIEDEEEQVREIQSADEALANDEVEVGEREVGEREVGEGLIS